MSREYPERPIVGIGAVVIKNDQVLLIRRGKPPRLGGLSLPGGAQKVGETVFEGALREVTEETGVEAEVLGLIDVVDSMTRDDDGRLQFHYTLIDVVCRCGLRQAEAQTFPSCFPIETHRHQHMGGLGGGMGASRPWRTANRWC